MKNQITQINIYKLFDFFSSTDPDDVHVSRDRRRLHDHEIPLQFAGHARFRQHAPGRPKPGRHHHLCQQKFRCQQVEQQRLATGDATE